MFGTRHFQRLARSGYGIVGGVIAIGAAAAAAGAAPAALTPWSSNEPPATTAAPTTTLASEPLGDGHAMTVVTTVTTAAPTTEPSSTAPATTAPATTAPATTVAPAVPEPALPVGDVPATTAPPTPPAVTSTTAAPATTEAPATMAAPQPEPEPATTAAAPLSDNVVPAGLSLACTAATTESGTDISCEWSGPVPAGFATFVLLRGNHSATGRVPFQSSDPSAHHFTDVALAPGSYTYVVVALDAAASPLVHSNMVPITSPAG